jgi:hypothetical protein
MNATRRWHVHRSSRGENRRSCSVRLTERRRIVRHEHVTLVHRRSQTERPASLQQGRASRN